MEMVIALAALILSILALSVFAACLVMLLMMGAPKEGEETPSVTADAVPPPSGREAKDDVEKRRREAVQARQHSNFMNYDGTEQAPIDESTILGE